MVVEFEMVLSNQQKMSYFQLQSAFSIKIDSYFSQRRKWFVKVIFFPKLIYHLLVSRIYFGIFKMLVKANESLYFGDLVRLVPHKNLKTQ